MSQMLANDETRKLMEEQSGAGQLLRRVKPTRATQPDAPCFPVDRQSFFNEDCERRQPDEQEEAELRSSERERKAGIRNCQEDFALNIPDRGWRRVFGVIGIALGRKEG